jgi:hypothetical protein
MLRKLIFHINSRHYNANMRLLNEACAELGLPEPHPPPPKEVVGGQAFGNAQWEHTVLLRYCWPELPGAVRGPVVCTCSASH